MLDAVGPYRKNGLLEIYGGDFRERRSGPISVSEADFEITHGQAWLIWSPDFTPARDATHLQIKFAAPPTTGKLTVGFILNDGQSLAWVLDLTAKSTEPAGLLPPVLPDDIVTRANSAQVVGDIKLAGSQVTVPLPPNLLLNLRNGQTKAISQWFVKVDGAAGTTMRFQTLALVRPAPPATTNGSHFVRQGRRGRHCAEHVDRIAGRVRRPRRRVACYGRYLRLHRSGSDETGFPSSEARRVRAFRNTWSMVRSVIRRATISSSTCVRSTLMKTAMPLIQPAQNSSAPASRLHTQRSTNRIAANTGQAPARSRSTTLTTFVNNQGYVDRDRFFDNPDNCIRLASTGGSDMVALQVRPFEKINILLEESLGVAMHRCVEVISAATDNGDIGTNYPRIRDYTSKFGVQGTLVSVLAGLVSQVSPTMLRDGLGFDPENSATSEFPP